MLPRESTSLSPELFELLEALCEGRLSPADGARLEKLVLEDVNARRAYLAYLDLHGTLHWNAAYGAEEVRFDSAMTTQDVESSSRVVASKFRLNRLSPAVLWMTAACLALVATLSFSLGRWGSPKNEAPPIAKHSPSEQLKPLPSVHSAEAHTEKAAGTGSQNQPVVLGERPRSPSDASESPTLKSNGPTNGPSKDVGLAGTNSSETRLPQRAASDATVAKTSRSIEGIVAVINEHLAAGWKVQGVEPSPMADDAEWLRRVYLDVVGHIPPVDVAERFLTDRTVRKRERLVESLLDDPAYVRNWTIIWTNLLVGRSDSRDVDRAALQSFLRNAFAKNRPWSELVSEFISAEGRFDENGATNFLLAHLNNQAVPATAITAKIFMGRQIGCTQCHDHPFNDWKQDTFWSFNSFFQQTKVARVDRQDAQTGKMKSQAAALETQHVGGPTHFETRRGLMQTVFPKFEGASVSDDADTNRRSELARLMTSGEKTLVSEAFVNRMWEHFFGCGFTRPVDDMGPHNPSSHPELMDHLAREFVASGYDMKQMIRWICLSDAYQRTSRFGKTNEADDPSTGTTPLFSRVYVKGMTAEQLYDSLLLATGADRTPSEAGSHDRLRHEWLQQFVHAFHTDENDESITFESTITQALLMMNSDLTQHALCTERGSLLEKLIHSRDSESDRIKRLCLATLTRYPTPKEQSALKKLVHEGAGSRSNLAGWQDALWAYLNSSEFILVH